MVTAGALVGLSLTPVLLVSTASYAVVEPAEPTVLFEEGFENTGAAPILLTDYTAADGVTTFSADSQWLEACNGNILAGNAVTSDITLTNCTARPGGHRDYRSVNAYYQLRQLSVALGSLNEAADPAANHVLSAFTDGKDPGAGVQLLSTPVNVPVNRYVALSIDAGAVNCAAGQAYNQGPSFEFSVIDSRNVTTSLGAAQLCEAGEAGTAQTVEMPKLANDDSGNPRNAQVATIQSVEAVKFAGGSLRAQIYNKNGSGSGNDAALDNLRILDVTPSLEKSFAPAVNTVGDTASLTLSVTNTADLAAGVAKCSVTVDVIAGEGTFVNGPDNIVSDFLTTDKLTDVSVLFGLPQDESEIETTPFNTPVTFEPFGNFIPLDGDETPTTADKSTFLFENGTTEQQTDEGLFEYDVTTGLITFTPVDGYTGTTPALPYTYKDSNGNTVNATAAVIVGGDIIDHEKAGELGQPVTVKLGGETENVDLTTIELIDPETEPGTDPKPSEDPETNPNDETRDPVKTPSTTAPASDNGNPEGELSRTGGQSPVAGLLAALGLVAAGAATLVVRARRSRSA